MSSPYYLLTIREVREEVPGTESFVLEPANGQQLTYAAGQYLTLGREQYGREVRRSYSISSAPALDKPLTLTVKRLDNGLLSRQFIDRARAGNQLRTPGAAGFFTLPPDLAASYDQLIFLAAGSGITPIFRR